MSLKQSDQAKNVTDAQICDVTNGLTDVSILSSLNTLECTTQRNVGVKVHLLPHWGDMDSLSYPLIFYLNSFYRSTAII